MQRIFLPPKKVSRQHLLSTKTLIGGATCPQGCKEKKLFSPSRLPSVTSTSVHSYSHKSFENHFTSVKSSCSPAKKSREGKETALGPDYPVGRGAVKREGGSGPGGAYFISHCSKRRELFLNTHAQARVSFSSINGVRAKEDVCTDFIGSQVRISNSAQHSSTETVHAPKKRSESLSLLGASYENLKRFSTVAIQESTHSDNKLMNNICINTLGTNYQGVHSLSTSAIQENPKNGTPDNSTDSSQTNLSNSEDNSKEKNETNFENKNDNSKHKNAGDLDDSNNDCKNDNGQPKKEVNFDEFGAWDHRIDLPILMDASIKHGAPIPLILASDVGCSTILGKRPYQEDRFVVENLPKNILCTAVFDGHGGGECSEYCSQNLKSVLLDELQEHRDLETVLHNAFQTLHSGYTDWVHRHNQGWKSGTTAAVCLLRGGVELAVGHVGDSRVILCRSGSALRLTTDHCPSLIAEKKRVLSSGGTVSVDNIGRHMVNDALSMSRSLGDLHLKPYGVISLPDTRTLRVKHGKDAFLLLITDGINFVLRSEEACNIINHAEDPYQAAVVLTEQALSMSSEDNMTAVVVPFGSWGKYTKSASMFYSFGIGRDMNKSSRFG